MDRHEPEAPAPVSTRTGGTTRDGRRHARVALLVPALSPWDAVGNDTRGLRDALEERGHPVSIFADRPPPDSAATPLSAAPAWIHAPDTLLIYQLATHWQDALECLRAARGTIVVRDHNVTPVRFLSFLGQELHAVQTLSERDRAMLAADRSVAGFWCASGTNGEELTALGAPADRISVVPPFNEAEELAREAPDPTIRRSSATGGVTAIFVGRVAPNKGHRLALRTAAAYRELFGQPLRLTFVGSYGPPFDEWKEVLDREAEMIGVKDCVEWIQGAPRDELRAHLEAADAFLCCSEHEGFCVPLVEAALVGVPIVARHIPAVAETLGPDALVLRDADEDLLATAVHRVATDTGVRTALVEAQRRWAEERFGRSGTNRALNDALALL